MPGIEKSQKEFDEYINKLDDKRFCKYSEALGSITLFCNYHLDCRFQSKVPLRLRGNTKFECNREKFIRLKKILG